MDTSIHQTGAGTSAAHNVLYKVRSKRAGNFYDSVGYYPSIFNPETRVEKFAFGVTERYASIFTKDQVCELYKHFEPSDLETIQLNGHGSVILQNKFTRKYYARHKCFTVDEGEATILDTHSDEYRDIKRLYDLCEVWHVVVQQSDLNFFKPYGSENATWDRFLSDLSDLYPVDREDSATDEELAHAGVRLRH